MSGTGVGMGTLRIEPVSAALGATVHGVSLAGALPNSQQSGRGHQQWDQLRRLLRERLLLVFPGQHLTDDEHIAVAAQFGRIAPEGLVEPRRVGFVSNHRTDGVLGGDAASFHIDFGFFPEPYEYLSLYGLEVPAAGTETHFVNAQRAAATLSPALRSRLAGLTARHVVDPASPGGQAGVRVRLGRLDESYVHQVRPVLWPHRDTGRDILGVWEQQTDALLPLEPLASSALIEELYAHLYQPMHTYVHAWAGGDLVVWDNHAVQHGRPDVGTSVPRTLRRVCIGATQDLTIFARAKTGAVAAGRVPLKTGWSDEPCQR